MLPLSFININTIMLLFSQDRKCLNATTAWVKTGERSKGFSLFIRGNRYTIIGVITVNGVLCYKVILGSATAEIFGLFYANEVVSAYVWDVILSLYHTCHDVDFNAQ